MIANESLKIEGNTFNISNTFMFSKSYIIGSPGDQIGIYNSLIYNGGGDQSSPIQINSQATLGNKDRPVLIISDNNISVTANGNARIYGVIFITDANQNFDITGNGNFNLYGSILSNSLNNNLIGIRGNFEINFDFMVLENLYGYFSDLLRKPVCPTKKRSLYHLLTTMKVF